MSALEMRGVRVAFSGRPVLDGVDLEVPEGGVFGFIGRNGAGKTTTMKVALGLLRPDAGEARVLGERVRLATRAPTGRWATSPTCRSSTGT